MCVCERVCLCFYVHKCTCKCACVNMFSSSTLCAYVFLADWHSFLPWPCVYVWVFTDACVWMLVRLCTSTPVYLSAAKLLQPFGVQHKEKKKRAAQGKIANCAHKLRNCKLRAQVTQVHTCTRNFRRKRAHKYTRSHTILLCAAQGVCSAQFFLLHGVHMCAERIGTRFYGQYRVAKMRRMPQVARLFPQKSH